MSSAATVETFTNVGRRTGLGTCNCHPLHQLQHPKPSMRVQKLKPLLSQELCGLHQKTKLWSGSGTASLAQTPSAAKFSNIKAILL